ncbi:hypothetical protein K437DRAFT_257751 [Tilletiaria anomala UBC 951]|uniref:SLC41A/MgtE integral membrane domain-containing protein n=1 Tax=Tilletiaria anomala (strain ATCC 24038 / CBS 436.72 / UBC 951) TaxID=1037660 RepID=A0A066VML5_TILAU|nr:uncharacterized protein K437DRAFT_257751 [Tilletiaria anomala UBC 951]KDN42726.1 hypothetical protein K437DRAFT_257751 [Tilletiaria anomala UBC 951]
MVSAGAEPDIRRHAPRICYEVEEGDQEERESQPLNAAHRYAASEGDGDDDNCSSDTFDSECADADDPLDGKHVARSPSGGPHRSTLRETWHIAREALPILVLALFSLMLAGELLIHLSRWPVFVKVNKLFIAVPILLNMKGNLEMNLSLRLSTSANIGELDTRRTRQALVGGNLALLQVQALIVSMLAGCLAFVLGLLVPVDEAAATNPTVPSAPSGGKGQQQRSPLLSLLAQQATQRLRKRRLIHGHPKPPLDPALKLRNGYFEFVMVIATGTLAASLSSAVLGSFMCALVILSRRYGVNPDNVASPLAASLGDLLTLILMGLLGSALVRFEGTILATLILGALIAFCAACCIIALRNSYVKQLLSSGWTPLLVAMFVSSGAGIVLDSFVKTLDGFALLVPVITGLPGACTAIFASRISTALHSSDVPHLQFSDSYTQAPSRPNQRPPAAKRSAVLIFWITPTEGWLVPLTLAAIGIGIAGMYMLLVWTSGHISFGWPFACCFLAFLSLTVAIALALSHFVCLYLWTRDYDPDIYCLPYVSSIIDFVGQLMLVCAFKLAMSLGDHITSSVGTGEA